jgi:hypothetical protein
VKKKLHSLFEQRYGQRPRNPTLRNLWDTLYDAAVMGWIHGYDASNAMWKRKGKRETR